MTTRGRRTTVAAVALLLIAGWASRRYAEGLVFVIRAGDMGGPASWIADRYPRVRETERMLSIPSARGSMRARLYWPDQQPRRTVLLVTGLHVAGIDEPRLIMFARELAQRRVAVVTPDIPELSSFDITSGITDSIESTATWLAVESGLAPDHTVGMMGISFSGGLSIVAAGRPRLRDHVAYVFALGGHDDLPRVLKYLCTGSEPAMEPGAPALTRPPHDYGVAVVLLGVADRMVPSGQVAPLRAAMRRFLWAAHLDRDNKPEAAREFAALRELERMLPEPSRTLLKHVNDRDVARLGPRLLPHIGSYGTDPALSVSKSPKPSAPVFLLHASDDNVIPAIESRYLAEDVRGSAPVRLLLSNVISHAAADRPMEIGEIMRLALFWGDLLAR
ncbi:MAG: hypothetical protein HY655_12845 [Acidobacteria bacterium]|nr:hypothetical protein [Acidobacteriota bacterium]